MNRRFVVVSALGLAACSADPVPLDTFYRLRASNPPARAGGPLKGVAEVPPLRGEGIINERAILYRVSGTELRQYSYHFWADTPSAITQSELIAALRKAGAFESVVKPEMRVNRDYEVLGHINKFEHDTGGSRSQVVVEIELSVRRLDGSRPLLMKTYTAAVDAAGSSVAAAVDAFTEAFSQIATAFVADLGAIS
jgi:cholesterol transport system auxiliary component